MMNFVQNTKLSRATQCYAETKKLSLRHPLYQALLAFEAALEASKSAPQEEAVPAKMMEVFSDGQWPALLFEFQPSLQLFSSPYDVISLHSAINEGQTPELPKKSEQQHILIFCDLEGQLIRPQTRQEYHAMTLMKERISFAAIANKLWPDLTHAEQQENMAEQLLVWLAEGLIIDAGVPIPDDAEFEQEFEGETC